MATPVGGFPYLGTTLEEAFRPPEILRGAHERIRGEEQGRILPQMNPDVPREPHTQPILPERLRELDGLRQRLTDLRASQKETQRQIQDAKTEIETRRKEVVEMLERTSALTHTFSTETVGLFPAIPDAAEGDAAEPLPPLHDLEDRFRTGIHQYLEHFIRQKQVLLDQWTAELTTIEQELGLVTQVNQVLPGNPTAEGPPMKCPICMDHDLNRCLIPCGHTLCSECVETLIRQGHPLCHLCRTPVERSIPFFLNGTEIGIVRPRPVAVGAAETPSLRTRIVAGLYRLAAAVSCRRRAVAAVPAVAVAAAPQFWEDLQLLNAAEAPGAFAVAAAPQDTPPS